MSSRLVLAMVLVLASGCGSSARDARDARESKYPPMPEGCEVKIFVEIPPMQTDNIGPVTATCDDSVSDADCLRTLKDQACKLGADLIWGVSDVPSNRMGKKKTSGRAAHTKAPKAP